MYACTSMHCTNSSNADWLSNCTASWNAASTLQLSHENLLCLLYNLHKVYIIYLFLSYDILYMALTRKIGQFPSLYFPFQWSCQSLRIALSCLHLCSSSLSSIVISRSMFLSTGRMYNNATTFSWEDLFLVDFFFYYHPVRQNRELVVWVRMEHFNHSGRVFLTNLFQTLEPFWSPDWNHPMRASVFRCQSYHSVFPCI